MSKAARSPAPQTFESAFTELESIVATMEAGQLPLEASLASYKRGIELLQFCQQALLDVQQQVLVLEANTLKNFPSADDNS